MKVDRAIFAIRGLVLRSFVPVELHPILPSPPDCRLIARSQRQLQGAELRIAAVLLIDGALALSGDRRRAPGHLPGQTGGNEHVAAEPQSARRSTGERVGLAGLVAHRWSVAARADVGQMLHRHRPASSQSSIERDAAVVVGPSHVERNQGLPLPGLRLQPLRRSGILPNGGVVHRPARSLDGGEVGVVLQHDDVPRPVVAPKQPLRTEGGVRGQFRDRCRTCALQRPVDANELNGLAECRIRARLRVLRGAVRVEGAGAESILLLDHLMSHGLRDEF
mmetsp:Transcript_140364/g.448636  ORF Transcript_140364/g.448636 Transcript_140364/m.448636 type:complete len:278 (+) Transcript_140364:311-1144(+)